MGKTVIITGGGSGFGELAAQELARAGHTVHAGIRDTTTRNAPAVERASAHACEHKVDLRTVELDVNSDVSVAKAVESVLSESGSIDVVIHNAGRLLVGPAEAWTPEETAAVLDTNVIGTQRVNRAVLPHMREREEGLLVWVGSSSTKGGTPPYLAPYFAAKAAMDAFAVSYAAELARFNIETSIVVPGVFARGTDLFAKASHPSEPDRMPAYDARYAGVAEHVGSRLAQLSPPDADAAQVAAAIVDVVGMPHGERPFRIHVDPVDDGSQEVSELADQKRVWFLGRMGLSDLLAPHRPGNR
ncbi:MULTISPECIES: SDR family NAD(P)-dependent oxidoreductase [unclassified Streptomyces]|uniref:SDR family NAD(P)-dependent oxidoreductase n=1 Tax=unclassified Streptomyces TaxID=2593676 RepID=UPI0036E464A5